MDGLTASLRNTAAERTASNPSRISGALGLVAAMLLAQLAAVAAVAAPGDLTAEVDRSEVHINESFTYVLRYEGDVSAPPDLSPFADCCEVLSESSNTFIQGVNGEYQRITEWNLVLMSRRAGQVTLPRLSVAGKRSNPVTIDVLPADDGEAPADIFLEVSAEPQHPYVQAQTRYVVKIFLGVETRGARLSEPETTGGETIIERLGEDRSYQTERQGKSFRVFERQYAIFPQAAGNITIEPLTFETQVLASRRFSRVQRFRSDAIELMVKPAPPPPANYPDAAWLPAKRVAIEEDWGRASDGRLIVGVPRTRTITVRADGVLATQLPELELADIGSLRQYPDQPELASRSSGTGIVAERRERMAVLAATAGSIEVSPAELPWFNVDTERWEIARTDARRFEVGGNSDAFDGVAEESAPPALLGDRPDAARPWQILSLVLGLGWLGTIVYRARDPRSDARKRRATREGAPPSERSLLAAVRQACRQNDARAAGKALIAWGRFRYEAGTLGELVEQVPEPLGREILRLQASLYGPNPARAWDGAALAASLSSAQRVRTAGSAPKAALKPLYP